MEPEKKLRNKIYGMGRIYNHRMAWNRHSKRTGQRVKRIQKRGCRAEIEKMLQGDEQHG